MKYNLKQGNRIIVNGIKRVYHGAFEEGHDFVRPIDNGRGIEYCLFTNLKSDEGGKLFGKVVKTFIAKPSPSDSIVHGSNSDLYLRGLNLWREAV